MRTLASLGALFCTAILTQSISAATHTDALKQKAAALMDTVQQAKEDGGPVAAVAACQTLVPDIAAALDEKYPNDMARGYSAGVVHGAWCIYATPYRSKPITTRSSLAPQEHFSATPASLCAESVTPDLRPTLNARKLHKTFYPMARTPYTVRLYTLNTELNRGNHYLRSSGHWLTAGHSFRFNRCWRLASGFTSTAQPAFTFA